MGECLSTLVAASLSACVRGTIKGKLDSTAFSPCGVALPDRIVVAANAVGSATTVTLSIDHRRCPLASVVHYRAAYLVASMRRGRS